MGRGPVCGSIMRLAGTAGVTGAVEAATGSAVGELTAIGVELIATGGSTGAAKVGGNSAAAGGTCGARGTAGATVEAAAFGSCGALFAGTATTVDAPVKPDEGGFTITGPCGARDAMAGVGVGVADTICGAWRGKGTILRGAGFEPAGALADSELADIALACVPAVAGLLPEGAATEELAAGAEAVGFAAPAATAVTVGAGDAVVTPRYAPGDSRCSFCC